MPNALASAADCLFAYGTLLFPELFAAVCGETRTLHAARLDGHSRYRVRGEHYPALVARSGGYTRGVLYEGLTAVDWQRLDDYEGTLYERRAVIVTVLTVPSSGEQRRAACTYLLADRYRYRLERRHWSAAAFASHHLAASLKLLT